MKIDREKFLFIYQQEEFKPLNDHQRAGLSDLFSFIEANEEVNDPRWIAYMLATTLHETAGTWQPIAEYGKGKGLKYGHPEPPTMNVFYGRGYVQLTWGGNYKTMGKILDVDLYQNPDLALQPDIAYKIMSYGMRHGTFTGASLKRYFSDTVTDWINARKIINGLDCSEKIAGYAVKFHRILEQTVIV